MEFRVLGPLEVREDGRALPLGGAKQRALLVLLLLHSNEIVPRDRLIDELWGDDAPESAVQSVQVYVSRLRKLLPPGTLLTRPPGYILEVDRNALDLHRFERLLGEGRDALATGNAEHAAVVLHRALALWRGPALAEFASERFAQIEIGRLEDMRLAAVEERVEADLALGRHADVIGELEALVAENPYRERLRSGLMLALYRSGRQADALLAYRDARDVFVDDLGIEPGETLRRLHKAILTQDAWLQTPPMRVGSSAQSEHAPPVTSALERRLMTVLFVVLDILNEAERDVEQARAFIEQIYREAQAEIEAAGGTAEEGVAGALLATFAVTSTRREDHAMRAISVALAIRNRLVVLFGDSLALRIGVESGEVILGRPGSFVSGMPVSAAAQLVRSANAGDVVIGERAASASGGAFELRKRDGAYLLVGSLAVSRRAAQIARDRKRRRLLLAAAFVVLAAAASAADIAAHHARALLTAQPNSVAVIDPGSNKVVGVVRNVGAGPGPIAFGSGALWVANLDDQTVSRLDPVALRPVRTLTVGAMPTDLAAANGALWVVGSEPSASAVTVMRIDPQFDTVAQKTRLANVVPGGPDSVATLGDAVWVAPSSGLVSRLDPRTGRVGQTIDANANPADVAVGAGAVWITDTDANTVTRIGPTGLLTPIEVGRGPTGLVVGAKAVWVADSLDDAIVRIDPNTRSPTATIPVGRTPIGVALGAGSVWVANSRSGTVTRIDPVTRKPLQTIPVGGSPQGVVFAAGRVWVTVAAGAVGTNAAARAAGTLRVDSRSDVGQGQVNTLDPARRRTR